MMLDFSRLNADRLRNSYYESELKKFDEHLFLRFDELKNKWMIFEYYPENVYIKPLFWLEDRNGNPIEYDHNFVMNKLNVMHMNWQHKESVGVNKWFDGLEAEADKQKQEMEEKIAEENLYMYRHDKLQWRKGARELLGRPAGDVFAGYPKVTKQTKGLDYGNIKLKTDFEQSELSGTTSTCVQSDAGKSESAS